MRTQVRAACVASANSIGTAERTTHAGEGGAWAGVMRCRGLNWRSGAADTSGGSILRSGLAIRKQRFWALGCGDATTPGTGRSTGFINAADSPPYRGEQAVGSRDGSNPLCHSLLPGASLLTIARASYSAVVSFLAALALAFVDAKASRAK